MAEIGSECRLSLHGRLIVVPSSSVCGYSWRMTWCAEGDGCQPPSDCLTVREGKDKED